MEFAAKVRTRLVQIRSCALRDVRLIRCFLHKRAAVGAAACTGCWRAACVLSLDGCLVLREVVAGVRHTGSQQRGHSYQEDCDAAENG